MDLDRDLSSIQETRNLLKAARKAQDTLKEFSQAQVNAVIGALKPPVKPKHAVWPLWPCRKPGWDNMRTNVLKIISRLS